MAKITPTILGIQNTQNQSIKDGITITAEAGSVIIVVNYAVAQNAISSISTVKIKSENFGSVINTKTSIKARQSNFYVVSSAFELEYTSNTSTSIISKNLKWSLESDSLYFNSSNDTQWEIRIKQPSIRTVETASFRDFNVDASKSLFPVGEDATNALCHFKGRDFENQEVWLEFDGDGDLANSFGYRFEAIEDLSPVYNYWIYITKYDANITNRVKNLNITVCAKSEATGNIVRYHDSNLEFRQNPLTTNLDLVVTIGQMKFNYKGGVIQGSLEYHSNLTVLGQITTPSWANYKVISNKIDTLNKIVKQTFEIIVSRNNLPSHRSDVLVFNSTNSDGSVNWTNKFNINQSPEPNRTDIGIWQDINSTFESVGLTEFELCDDETDNILYRGYAYPINGVCNLNLKDIMSNYISTDIQFLSVDEPSIQKSIGKYFYDNNSARVFYLRVGGEIIQTFHVVYNWSFENDYLNKLTNEYVYLNMPIQRLVDARQYCFLSRFHFNEIQDLRDEDTLTAYIPYKTLGFTAHLISTTSKINNVSFKIPEATEENKKYINKMEIRVNSEVVDTFKICQDGCHKYCLYYVNKYGGVDWFLFGDTSKETRNITNSTAKINNRNTAYNKNIKQTWTLRTELLSDKQSALIPNMMESTCLYLHDLESNDIIPVSITDKTYELKTIRNNGRKFYNYTIKVESQLDRKIIL